MAWACCRIICWLPTHSRLVKSNNTGREEDVSFGQSTQDMFGNETCFLTLCVGLLVGFFVGGFHPDIIEGGGVGFHIMLGGDASDLEEEPWAYRVEKAVERYD